MTDTHMPEPLDARVQHLPLTIAAKITAIPVTLQPHARPMAFGHIMQFQADISQPYIIILTDGNPPLLQAQRGDAPAMLAQQTLPPCIPQLSLLLRWLPAHRRQ